MSAFEEKQQIWYFFNNPIVYFFKLCYNYYGGEWRCRQETVKNKFGALYNAFKFGAPPHAGAAPGIDRMIMLLLGETNIREVIAFPKNSKARDLLMQAPNYVTEEQLRDVHIKIDVKDKKKED